MLRRLLAKPGENVIFWANRKRRKVGALSVLIENTRRKESFLTQELKESASVKLGTD